jgi:hypothetical protein
MPASVIPKPKQNNNLATPAKQVSPNQLTPMKSKIACQIKSYANNKIAKKAIVNIHTIDAL